jgi:hypothetical protein
MFLLVEVNVMKQWFCGFNESVTIEMMNWMVISGRMTPANNGLLQSANEERKE